MKKVVIYSKDHCIQCTMTEKFLNAHHVKFEERNINQHPQYIGQLKAHGFMRMPVVVVSGKKGFSGFQPDKLNQLAI